MKKLLLFALLVVGCTNDPEPASDSFSKWGSWVSTSNGIPRKYDLHINFDSNSTGLHVGVAYIGSGNPAPLGDTLGVFAPLVTYTPANGRYRLQWTDTLTAGNYGIDSARYDISLWHNSVTDLIEDGGAWIEYKRGSVTHDSTYREWIDGFHRVPTVKIIDKPDEKDTPNPDVTYRCQGITQAGERCKRNVKGAFYCWQHD